MTVFTFNIFYENDFDSIQKRYVLANTEEEAEQKLEAYYDELSKEGFLKPTVIAGGTVELDNVIV